MTALDTAVPKRRPRIGATISDRVRGLGLKLPALQAIWVKERSHPVLVKGAAFFALGATGFAWIPFYPWWAILFFAFVIGALALRFPLFSLISMGVLVSAAAAAQMAEFGLFFLVFTLVVSLVSLFDWRFGYLVFGSVFLSLLGAPFLPPLFAAVVYSRFLAVAAMAASATFLSFLVTCGNVTVAGLFVGPPHGTSFMVFGTAPRPDWTPGDLGGALSSIGLANPDVMSGLIASNFGASLVPLLEVALWCGATFLVAELARRRDTIENWVRMALAAGGALAAGYVLSSLALGVPIPLEAAPVVLGAFGLIAGTTAGGFLGKEAFREYFLGQTATTVGRRLADLPEARSTKFSLVGGLADVKADLRESILVPLKKPDVAAAYGIAPPRGILLFGPPGCGKTLLMSALAGELNVEMFTVKCSDVMSKWYGESEQKIEQLFRTAKERRPAIIFFDDIDAIAKSRDLYAGDDVTPRLLGMILSEIDGLDKSPGLIMVGTTNKPELLDSALLRPGRFDKIIYVPPPSKSERLEILDVHLRGRPATGDVDLAGVADRTDRFSGADLANLVTEAAVLAMKRSLSSGETEPIDRRDFLEVLPKVKPSISLAQAEEYARLRLIYERKMHHLERAAEEVGWADVRGLEDLKASLRATMDLVFAKGGARADFRLKASKGVLLFGPPGCGKSYLMRAAANELGVPIQGIEGPSLLSAGRDGGAHVKEIFYIARENAPSVVLFDDIDLVASVQDRSPDARNLLSQFLAQLDSIGEAERVLVVATTNRPHVLDPSLLRPGRFDTMFYVAPPDADVRLVLVESALRGVPTAGVHRALLAGLCHKAEGFSSADVLAAVDEAKLLAIREAAGAIRPAHLEAAFGRVRPSVTPESLGWSREFIRAHNVRLPIERPREAGP